MSQSERDRLLMLNRVKRQELSLSKAAKVMGVSYRQAKRIWRRFKNHGDAGLVHRLRGRPSPRRIKEPLRRKILELYQRKFPDFGPTLAAEHLAKAGLKIDHETLRRWLLEKGKWTIKRKRQKHRSWRERVDCLGEMVQMDGSHHKWFEDRREEAVLMVMVDDATNLTYARLFEGETMEAAFTVFEKYVEKNGLPGSLYVDRDSIYRTDREPTLEEQMKGELPKTHFGRAMERLGVKIILAYSPQAKGRVERRNGLFQDRLVKEMRLKGIKTLEEGNEFLEKEFLPELNRRFRVVAKEDFNLHRKPFAGWRELLCREEKRRVSQDWTVQWGGELLQIHQQHENLNLAGKEVVVRERECGKRSLLFGSERLRWKRIEKVQKIQPAKLKLQGNWKGHKPAKSHPWRGAHFDGKRGRSRLHSLDSVPPPLRSGSTSSKE